jgi:hypothetical protein
MECLINVEALRVVKLTLSPPLLCKRLDEWLRYKCNKKGDTVNASPLYEFFDEN